jgi:hypothetical protein
MEYRKSNSEYTSLAWNSLVSLIRDQEDVGEPLHGHKHYALPLL